jgi:hypothetical protein
LLRGGPGGVRAYNSRLIKDVIMRELDRQGQGPGTGAKRFLGRSGSAARLARFATAIFLDPSADSGKTVRFVFALPGADLFLRKLIPPARFLEGDLAGIDGRY